MSLEQDNNLKKYKKLHEKSETSINTKDLLQELAIKISREYGIDVSKVKELIGSKTENKLAGLKSSLGSLSQNINMQEFQSVISGARNVIEKASKEKIEVLKGSIDTPLFSPKEDFYITEKVIPQNLLKKAKNPQNLGDNIIGASIGIINSAESTVQLLYKIGAGIIQAPYHIYLVISGKGDYEGFKRV